MASVVAHTTMSLDGFIAGPNDEMDWVCEHAGDVPPGLVDQAIATTGAILGGRRGYEVARRAERPETAKPFGGRWTGPISSEGLLDEILILVLPVLLGDGVRLLREPGAPTRLEAVEISRSGQVANLRYRVVR